MTLIEVINAYSAGRGPIGMLVRYKQDDRIYRVVAVTKNQSMTKIVDNKYQDLSNAFNTSNEYDGWFYVGHTLQVKLHGEDKTTPAEDFYNSEDRACTCLIHGPTGLMAVGCTCGHLKRR